ncbi:exosome non-catalytic core subunit rrp40 [Pichia californica]|nr:exosome non-catalytic core subunit rrp40 [[Candida] californica]
MTTTDNSLNLVIPGDSISLENNDISNIALGPNVTLENDSTLQPTTAGLFVSSSTKGASKNLYYVDTASGRYVPQVGDLVVGTIIGQFGEYYRVSINEFSKEVLLNIFAFPNASKKNRPRLQVRELIYARVSSTEKSVDVELSCVDPTTGKDGGFGALSGGYTFNVSCAYARFLLFTPNAPVLKKMVEKLQFEIAIGVNGKVWIKSDSSKATMLCVYIISESQNWKQSEISENVDKSIKKFKSL